MEKSKKIENFDYFLRYLFFWVFWIKFLAFKKQKLFDAANKNARTKTQTFLNLKNLSQKYSSYYARHETLKRDSLRKIEIELAEFPQNGLLWGVRNKNNRKNPGNEDLFKLIFC